ncbi:hypothetical protein [Rickettsia endosymbiont of Ceutorhynchus obstrictus]|uniref:hypothetical protein n=1 Tax=Rickettsia endosymbiont of Ceutorhynchus obstrictus TaxID=3066249 RepID=UPI0031330985
MVKPRHDIAVLLKNTQNIAIFDPCGQRRYKPRRDTGMRCKNGQNINQIKYKKEP